MEETSNTVEKGEVFQKFLNVEAKSPDFDGDKEQVVASLGMRMQVSKRRSIKGDEVYLKAGWMSLV